MSRALADAENALRDFVAAVLGSERGNNWVESCGVSEERVSKWRERKETEGKRQPAGVVEERLIYYADFYDLKTILKKNWSGTFAEALGDWRTIEVYLSDLETLRDPDAHRRELLPHQKSLIHGISGEIRNRIIRYRSKKETEEDFFPRIESARDSLGNIWVPAGDAGTGDLRQVSSDHVLRVGDAIDYVITARDPEDLPLEYGIRTGIDSIRWSHESSASVVITADHIQRGFWVEAFIRSPREYHAGPGYDDKISFNYKAVLPKTDR